MKILLTLVLLSVQLFAAEHAVELLEAELKISTGSQRVCALVAVTINIVRYLNPAVDLEL